MANFVDTPTLATHKHGIDMCDHHDALALQAKFFYVNASYCANGANVCMHGVTREKADKNVADMHAAVLA